MTTVAIRTLASKAAIFLWYTFGVTHDPRVYRCRICGHDCRRVHDHMTLGHAERLCGGCFSNHCEWAVWIRINTGKASWCEILRYWRGDFTRLEPK